MFYYVCGVLFDVFYLCCVVVMGVGFVILFVWMMVENWCVLLVNVGVMWVLCEDDFVCECWNAFAVSDGARARTRYVGVVN